MSTESLNDDQFKEQRLNAVRSGQMPLPGFRMTGEELAAYPHEVEVYRNLHTPEGTVKYSAKDRKTGTVIAHAEDVTLDNVSPVVHEAGRQRVIAEGKKNVHAVLRGTPSEKAMRGGKNLTYNPYQNETFVDKDSGAPVVKAKRARLSSKQGKSTVRYR